MVRGEVKETELCMKFSSFKTQAFWDSIGWYVFFDDLNLVLIIILILHSRALRSCVKSGISTSERTQFDSEKREREATLLRLNRRGVWSEAC